MDNKINTEPQIAKSELQKMLAGELYMANESQLTNMRLNCNKLVSEFNKIDQSDNENRNILMQRIFAKVGMNCHITPPFQCDYGSNLYLGDNVYMNYNCVILDCAKVEIGEGTLFAPGVQVYAATHPIDPDIRKTGLELAKPIKIGKNCWIGGCAIILPGVTIGDNTTIGAGSVVTKDIPSNVVAVGNPCKVIKEIER